METPRIFEDQSPQDGRIDKILSLLIPGSSRSFLAQLLLEGQVKLNGKTVTKKSQKVLLGDQLSLEFPPLKEIPTPVEDLKLKILFEDEHMIALHKPAGILTHPLHPGQGGTLVSGALYLCHDLSGINGVLRPGIVHRLDRETSGVILMAKSDQAMRGLQKSFHDRLVKKTYFALAYGQPDFREGWVKEPLARDPKRRNLRRIDRGGKKASTKIEIIKSWGRFHLVKARPKTGRTHQIRVHLKFMGIPILGDLSYGGRHLPRWLKRVQLHAFMVQLSHPVTKQELRVHSSLEADMLEVIHRLNRGERYVW